MCLVWIFLAFSFLFLTECIIYLWLSSLEPSLSCPFLPLILRPEGQRRQHDKKLESLLKDEYSLVSQITGMFPEAHSKVSQHLEMSVFLI